MPSGRRRFRLMLFGRGRCRWPQHANYRSGGRAEERYMPPEWREGRTDTPQVNGDVYSARKGPLLALSRASVRWARRRSRHRASDSRKEHGAPQPNPSSAAALDACGGARRRTSRNSTYARNPKIALTASQHSSRTLPKPLSESSATAEFSTSTCRSGAHFVERAPMCFHRTILFHVATNGKMRVPTLSGNGHFPKISKSFLKVCWVSGAQRRTDTNLPRVHRMRQHTILSTRPHIRQVWTKMEPVAPESRFPRGASASMPSLNCEPAGVGRYHWPEVFGSLMRLSSVASRHPEERLCGGPPACRAHRFGLRDRTSRTDLYFLKEKRRSCFKGRIVATGRRLRERRCHLANDKRARRASRDGSRQADETASALFDCFESPPFDDGRWAFRGLGVADYILRANIQGVATKPGIAEDYLKRDTIAVLTTFLRMSRLGLTILSGWR